MQTKSASKRSNILDFFSFTRSGVFPLLWHKLICNLLFSGNKRLQMTICNGCCSMHMLFKSNVSLWLCTLDESVVWKKGNLTPLVSNDKFWGIILSKTTGYHYVMNVNFCWTCQVVTKSVWQQYTMQIRSKRMIKAQVTRTRHPLSVLSMRTVVLT